MELVTFIHEGRARLGARKDARVLDLRQADPALPGDMVSLLQGGDPALARAKAAVAKGKASLALDQVELQAPVPVPPRIFAVGLNYLEHFNEIPEAVRKARGMKPPETPVIFNKQSTAANGPYQPILLPPESVQMDHEAELGLVIGRTCRRVSQADAMQVVAGFLLLNDVSIRDWQRASPTMTMGKSWDSHCPMGPALVTRDQLPDPYGLEITLSVDGEERQRFRTRDMLFSIEEQIAHLSTAFTLLPGDVIATGTGKGVIAYRPGQPWLRPGQKVRIEAPGLGHLENQVEKDPGASYIR